MTIRKYIPNSITSLNLSCGVLATGAAFSGELLWAGALIVLGAVFDFFDGAVARALGVSSPIGKELDSLADEVSFGLAPAAMWSAYMTWLLTGDVHTRLWSLCGSDMALSAAPLILAVFAGLRLAKFNCDERQHENFIGLTTTATGLFTASLFALWPDHADTFRAVLGPAATLATVGVFCFLLVCEMPMFSLKMKNLRWSGNELRWVLVGVAVVSVALLGLGGLAATILLYIAFCLVRWGFRGGRNREQGTGHAELPGFFGRDKGKGPIDFPVSLGVIREKGKGKRDKARGASWILWVMSDKGLSPGLPASQGII